MDSATFERSEQVCQVFGLGLSVVRTPTWADERVFGRYYDDSGASATEFVNAVVSHATVSPTLSYEDVGALSSQARQELRAAIAIACRLPNDVAASDSALLVAMRGRRDRLASRAKERTRGLVGYVQEALDEVRARGAAAARGDIQAALERWTARIQEVGEAAEAAVSFFEEQPCGFVVGEMKAAEAMTLLLEADEHGDHVVADALGKALLGDSEFLEKVELAVNSASSLNDAQNEELCDGLVALREERFPSACRLLMGVGESVIWTGGAAEGVVDQYRKLLKTATPGRPAARHAKSVNNLLDQKDGLQLRESYRLFLHKQMWNGHGHDLRHGRVHSRQRDYSLYAVVGLCGWLDRQERSFLMLEVGERLDAVLAPSEAPV